MNLFLLFIPLFLSVTVLAQNYPDTRKTPKTINKHNIPFQDDYTWLEDMRGKEVADWVEAQNKLAEAGRDRTMAKIYPLPAITKYDNQTNYRIPNKERLYYYSLLRRRDRELQTPMLFYKKKLDEAFIELVNPNYFYSGKTVNIIDYTPSVNSKTLAYKIMIDGSDRHEVRFVTISNGKKFNDVLKGVKFGNIAWKGDEGVFYNRTSNSTVFSIDSTYQIYYHKLGADVKEDKLFFDASGNEGQMHYFTSQDGKRLLLSVANKEESHINYYYADLTVEEPVLKKYLDNAPSSFTVEGYNEGKIYFSSHESNWGDIRYLDLNNPEERKVLIPQYQNQLLIKPYFFKDRIVCKYKNQDGNYLMVFDYTGKFIKKILIQKGMGVNITGNDYYDKDIFFYVSSYTIPPIMFTLNLESGNYERFVSRSHNKTTAPFPIDYFSCISTTYTSRDGVQVPITIVHKKGIELNGNNPALLEAYGGFGVISSPRYDVGLLYFLEKGGIYAYAEVRGGGDKGLDWHRQGRGLKKINTLNDFIDAAKFLFKENYTSPEKLGITGASQGGLLVGAALVQHPEMFKVAIPKVGIYDMAKFHQYTIGRFHYDEYGNPEDAEDFAAMMQYSPYHNIKEDINYPVTLIVTSDNDDRVPPVHSYKFAAKLQQRPAQTNPVYLQTRLQSGHYGVMTSHEDRLADKAEFYSFLLYHLTQK